MHEPKDMERAVLSFADMKLDRWSGLPACASADMARILGAGGPLQPGGSLGGFRRFPGRAATPLGVLAWLGDGDRVVAVGAYSPELPALKDLIGPPEHVAPSLVFSPSHEQWIYASLGLVAHFDKWAMKVSRVYGFAATTVEAYLQSQLALVEATERMLG
jgi:hypothetical protein